MVELLKVIMVIEVFVGGGDFIVEMEDGDIDGGDFIGEMSLRMRK